MYQKRKVRKNGFSNYLSVTGFAEVGEQFRLERIDDKSFKVIKVED